MTLVLVDRAVDRGEAVVDAALRCVARWGWGKTTIDDIAREAGVGRATLYRLFPGGRDAVLDAVVSTEAHRVLAQIDEVIADALTLEDAVVAILVEAHRTLATHDALQFVMAHEPEVILPHMTFQQMGAILAVAAASIGPRLTPWIGDPELAARGAEWLTRIVLSYLFVPSTVVVFGDPASVRRFVRAYVVPGLRPA